MRNNILYNVFEKILQFYFNSIENKQRISKTILGTTTVDPVVIIPVSKRVTREFLKSGKHRKKGRIYRLKTSNQWVTIAPTTIGAPALEIHLNALYAAGAKYLIRADFCGSLSNHIHVGDLVIAGEAIINEGVGKLYSGSERSFPDKELLRKFQEHVTSTHTKGNSSRMFFDRVITVDYYFAQDKEILGKWASLAACVDMETSALYAMAMKMKLSALSIMTVSDEKLSDVEVFVSKDFPFANLLRGIDNLVTQVLNFVNQLDVDQKN